MKVQYVICAIALFGAAGCSSTPGDAAASGGHAPQAADLYQRGADQGDADAAFKLARLLEKGTLHDSTYGNPGDWYVRACDLGNVIGCHNAGTGFEYGTLGLEKNYEKARSFYTKAAEHGYMQSEYNLGSLYANQYFVDNVEGLAWLMAAQNQARKCLPDALCKWVVDDPPHHMTTLKSRMTPDEIAKAQARSQSMSAGI